VKNALRHMKEPPANFSPPQYQAAEPVRVAYRGGEWLRDNGNCRIVREILYVVGYAPEKQADCKPNEVDVPQVVGATLAEARAQLAAAPLSAEVITRPARAGERLGVVVDQYPKGGAPLSSWDTVRLVMPKPTEGVVPRVVGLEIERAEAILARHGLEPVVESVADAGATVVVAQRPRAGAAAARELPVTLRVGRG
jgi:hypothetical protein